MSAPKRIQRRRSRGWRMPDGAVYVGRPTKFGNPYTVEMMQNRIDELAAIDRGDVLAAIGPRQLAYDAFRSDLRYGPDSQWWWFGPHMQMITICVSLDELKGKDLACWCPLDEPCHADVLLAIANDAGHGRCHGD